MAIIKLPDGTEIVTEDKPVGPGVSKVDDALAPRPKQEAQGEVIEFGGQKVEVSAEDMKDPEIAAGVKAIKEGGPEVEAILGVSEPTEEDAVVPETAEPSVQQEVQPEPKPSKGIAIDEGLGESKRELEAEQQALKDEGIVQATNYPLADERSFDPVEVGLRGLSDALRAFGGDFGANTAFATIKAGQKRQRTGRETNMERYRMAQGALNSIKRSQNTEALREIERKIEARTSLRLASEALENHAYFSLDLSGTGMEEDQARERHQVTQAVAGMMQSLTSPERITEAMANLRSRWNALDLKLDVATNQKGVIEKAAADIRRRLQAYAITNPDDVDALSDAFEASRGLRSYGTIIDEFARIQGVLDVAEAAEKEKAAEREMRTRAEISAELQGIDTSSIGKAKSKFRSKGGILTYVTQSGGTIPMISSDATEEKIQSYTATLVALGATGRRRQTERFFHAIDGSVAIKDPAHFQELAEEGSIPIDQLGRTLLPSEIVPLEEKLKAMRIAVRYHLDSQDDGEVVLPALQAHWAEGVKNRGEYWKAQFEAAPAAPVEEPAPKEDDDSEITEVEMNPKTGNYKLVRTKSSVLDERAEEAFKRHQMIESEDEKKLHLKRMKHEIRSRVMAMLEKDKD